MVRNYKLKSEVAHLGAATRQGEGEQSQLPAWFDELFECWDAEHYVKYSNLHEHLLNAEYERSVIRRRCEGDDEQLQRLLAIYDRAEAEFRLDIINATARRSLLDPTQPIEGKSIADWRRFVTRWVGWYVKDTRGMTPDVREDWKAEVENIFKDRLPDELLQPSLDWFERKAAENNPSD